MKELIEKIPIPIAGLILALAAVGNLLESYGQVYRSIFGSLSAILLVLLLLKMTLYWDRVKEDLKNPLVASVFPTFTMGLILLSTYVKEFFPNFAYAIWIIAVIGHMILLIRFTINFVIGFDIKKVFPSWFIVYAGIAVGSVTAPAFEMQGLGKVFFWFALVLYFLLLPKVIKRVRSIAIGEAALATLAIFAAPLALCLAGYMNSYENKNMNIVVALLVISQLSYLFALLQLPKLIKLKFYPSFSGFTFPLVISAISLKLTNIYLISSGRIIPIISYIVKFEEIVAVSVVLFVLFKYLQFLIIPLKFERKVYSKKQEELI